MAIFRTYSLLLESMCYSKQDLFCFVLYFSLSKTCRLSLQFQYFVCQLALKEAQKKNTELADKGSF